MFPQRNGWADETLNGTPRRSDGDAAENSGGEGGGVAVTLAASSYLSVELDSQPRSARFGRQPSAFANCSSTAEMRGPNVASSSLALRDTSGRPALRL